MWKDLEPDPRMVAALDYADGVYPRTAALVTAGKGNGQTREERHRWSNAFADACARMIAAEMRRQPAFKGLHVLPGTSSNAEPPTYVAGDKTKRVDVVVSSLVSGLQVGISLKGMNFRDEKGGQFDKNLTGRTYELQDEIRVIHEYQPASLLGALYFLPLAATVDKRGSSSPSSFARTVEHLRARTGRIDPSLPSQLSRADIAAVALYCPGDVEVVGGKETYRDPFPRGVVRYFDVQMDPPKRGRPKLGATLALEELVALIAVRFASGGAAPIAWAEPEAD